MTPRYLFIVTILTAAMAVGACNKSDAPSSPLSPSPLPAVSGSSGATISGVVSLDGASMAGMTVSVAGTTLVAPVDSSGRFSLTAVPAGDIELRFSGGAIDTSLAIAGVTDQDQIQLAVTVDGAASTVTSSQLTSSDRIEVKGVIASLSGACPDLTFTVNGFQAVTNASTRFEDAPCSGVQNGTKVEVKGTRQANGSILARKVDVDGVGPDVRPEVKVDGTVSSLGGACPDRTFTVAGTAIVTNSATRFEDGTCATLQAGTLVQVKGTRQPNGSVLATSIDIDNPAPDVKVEGIVAGLTGACPAVTFTINGTTIVTNSTTQFEDGLCTAIQNGTNVDVKGTQQADGTVLAIKIDIDNPDPDVKVEGIVAGLTGACPAVTFSINGTTIVTNSTTQFEDGLCTVIQNGTNVDVKGTQQPNGTVLAAKIDIDNPDPEVKVEGIVSGRSGACPAVTFSVGSTTVVTDAATRFDDGSCGTLQNGTSVEVKGTRQPNGTVLAAKIDIDDSAPEVKLKGTVAGLGGACPSLTFTVNGSAAATNSATRYEDGSCGSIKNGTRVEVRGPRQPNGSVLAAKVDIDN